MFSALDVRTLVVSIKLLWLYFTQERSPEVRQISFETPCIEL